MPADLGDEERRRTELPQPGIGMALATMGTLPPRSTRAPQEAHIALVLGPQSFTPRGHGDEERDKLWRHDPARGRMGLRKQ